MSRNGSSFYRYYRPLKVGKVCLTCHGPVETLDPELRKTLKELYPEDRATGYRAGDLRGVVSVTLVPAKG